MKKISRGIMILCFVSFVTFMYGQNKPKLGHINSNELLEKIPGRDSAKAKIEKYAKDVQGQYKAMQGELETKYADYQANEKNMTDLIKKTKMDELKDLQDRIDNFQKSAQEDMQKKENEFLKPIIDRAKKAIEEVAKDNNYTYIFDTASGIFLYTDPGDDVMALVKKKLGLK
jgi:outer membrane protein